MAKNRQFIRQKGANAGYRGKPEDIDGSGEGLDGDDTLVDIVEVKEQATDFFEKNQTLILGALVGLVLLLGGYLGYKYGYQGPREKAGLDAMYQAEYQFKIDSFALALTNPGAGMEGFLDIIDSYSGTKASNLSKYYAGVSYLNLGQFDAAIEYLKEYNANDDVTSVTKMGALGDAYAEKGDLGEAASYYQKATKTENGFLAPYYMNKLAILHLSQNENDKAAALFEEINAEFPQSAEAREATKYLAMLKAK